MTNHIAHSLAARTGISASLVETQLRNGLTPNEILACAGINTTQTYVDAFDLALRHKARAEANGTQHMQSSHIARWPAIPHLGTIRRTKRLTALGAMTPWQTPR